MGPMPIRWNVFNKIDKMDSKLVLKWIWSLWRQYVDDVEFHDSNGNGFGDIWWTDKLIYFSSIDVKTHGFR